MRDLRIAISSPMRWATGLAAVVTIAIFAMGSSSPLHSAANPSGRSHADTGALQIQRELGRIRVEQSAADRIELAAIERDLDAMIDQLQVAADAVAAATSGRERALAREALARLEVAIRDRAQHEQDRSDELRSRLGE